MKLIVSAFRKDVNPWRNAQQTAMLLKEVQARGLLGQLVIGTFQGSREIAVEVTGYVNEDIMVADAQHWLYRFNQTSVFAERCGKAYILSRAGTEYIGEVVHNIAPGVFKQDGTEYLDGRTIAVMSIETGAKQAA